MTSPALIRETFPVGPLQCNCTILGDPVTGDALVVDPGDDADVIVARLQALGLRPTALVHTHAHFDHVGGARGVSEATGAGIRLHEGDRWLYEHLDVQGAMFGMTFDEVLPVEAWLKDGDVVGRGRTQVEVLHTPGHTPGSVCFRCSLGNQELLFSGDTLFRGSIGRTDLWGGDYPTIEKSIKSRLYGLGEETYVIPGHGPATTIGRERRSNAFVRL
jgi:hydroxyacylglutathione hydrolase